MNDLISRGTTMIRSAERILVFTGAGMSTESGIPDFRSPGGVWSRYDPSEFYFDKFVRDAGARQKYWQMSSEFYQGMRDARPNTGHLAIKILEDSGRLLGIVTQNVDRLHHKAGNSPDKIIEVHGTVFTVSCLSCGDQHDRDTIEARLNSGEKVPVCTQCGGILKPDTISFGQAMPADKMERAFDLAGRSDLCLVLGSSLVVYPAAAVPAHALRSGAQLMIINRDETPLDPEAHLVVHDTISVNLHRMIDG